MIVCPLCDHAQAGGLECERCGRPLPLPPAQGDGLSASPDARALEGFEPTGQGAADAPAVAPLADLEPTGHAPFAAAPVGGASLFPDLEPTLSAPIDDPFVEPFPELERVAAPIPDQERTPFPALVRCRYCGTEGGLGERLCNRCGMRLPVPEAFPARALDEGAVRCGCGMRVTGSRCPSCGARREG